MREILFRGKRIFDEQWVYGTMYKISIDLNPFIITLGKLGCSYQVDEETVGQYTGLIDKNGVKIFEGDIVGLFGMKGKVVQERGAFGIAFIGTIDYDLLESKMPFNNSANFCFNDNFISLWEIFWNYEQVDNTLYDVEVIGNAHDNPELLEK